MGDQKVEDLLRSARHQSESIDKTKLHPSQPLNVIAGDGMDTPSPAMVDDEQCAVIGAYPRKDSPYDINESYFPKNMFANVKKRYDDRIELKEGKLVNKMVDQNYDPEKIIDKEGGWQPHNKVCEICQIERIVGTCSHCGIWQYCSGDEGDDQFDIKVRRRQNGTSTKPSDVESDS